MENFVNNIQDGVVIMLIGMGVVFGFLAIMVFAMNLMSKIMQKLNAIFPEEIDEDKYAKKQNKSEDNEIALAIALACAKRRI